MMKIYYDSEGDLLEVQFGTGVKDKRTGIGLTDQITLFCDSTIEKALGFTVTAYSKLLLMPKQSLNELNRTPKDVKTKVISLLKKPQINQFIHVIGEKIGLEDVKMSRLVGI